MVIRNLYPTIKPTLLLDFANSKVLDPRITFTRASSAVYYDGTTTAKAEENLLLHSQGFDVSATWSRAGNATVTADDQLAPDGTQTADTISLPENLSRLTQTFTAVTGTYTASIFLKGTIGETTRIELGGISNALQVTFTGDWQRVSITASLTAGSSNFVIIRRSGSGDTASTVYAWGAQLELRSSLTSYTATTTQPITRYQPVLLTAANNIPRFDHNPVTEESLGFLIEEQRTNLATRSEEIGTSPWGFARASAQSNVHVAPDGTLTANKLVDNTETGSHDVSQNYTVTSGQYYTFSVYVKAAERTECSVRLNRLSGGNLFGTTPNVVVNLSNGAIVLTSGGTGSSVTDAGNGWYRVRVTGLATGSGTQSIAISPTVGGISGYAGDGYSGIYVWGAQLENNSFATSYIKTVAAQATRSADAASMTGTNFSSWYNQTEGTIFAESSRYLSGASGQQYVVCEAGVNVNNNDNLISLASQFGSSSFQYLVVSGGATQCVILEAGVTTMSKYMCVYKLNDFAYTKDAATPTTDTSGTVPSVNQFNIGSRPAFGGVGYLNGYIRKISYYNTRLPNTELQALSR
jgi:hypothetical protein